MPENAQRLNIRNGTDTKYSWKKALMKKTLMDANILPLPLANRGMYRCLYKKNRTLFSENITFQR
jgi:hypothetical protein